MIKLQIFISIFFYLIMFSNTIYAQIPKELLNQQWQVEFDAYRHIRNMGESEWEDYKNLSVLERKKIVESMRQQAKQATFEFHDNQTFRVKLLGEVIEEGNWKVHEDGKTIIAYNQKGYEDKITIRSIQTDKIIIDSEQYGQEVVLVPMN